MLRLIRVFLVWSVNLFVLAPLAGAMIGAEMFPEDRPESEPVVPPQATPLPSMPTSPKPQQRREHMLVTAYCLCEKCCGKWAKLPNRVTSTGDDATICDGVAADPKLLPYRTKLWIPGLGCREVDDTGGAMRQDAERGIFHIDVRFPSHREARIWGKQWLDVQVLETPN